MHVAEIKAEGLVREYQVALQTSDLIAKMDGELKTLQAKAQIKGFRPGKAPLAFLRRLYGAGLTQDVLRSALEDVNRHIIATHALKPVAPPQIDLPIENAEGLEKLFDGSTDALNFTLSFEVLPSFELPNLKGMHLERQVCAVSEEEVNEAINKLVTRVRTYTPRAPEEGAQIGDKITYDQKSTMDGAPYENGTFTDAEAVLGTGTFLEGVDEQLLGIKAGETRHVAAHFPNLPGFSVLAGRAVEHDITATRIESPDVLELDDAFAQRFEHPTMDSLRAECKASLEEGHNANTRQKLKRAILDKIAEVCQFEAPKSLVEQELAIITENIRKDLAQAGVAGNGDDASNEATRAEFLPVAERRIRLGLFFNEFTRVHKFEVSQEEVTQAVIERVRRYPGSKEGMWNYYKKNPDAVESLKSQLLEDKCIDAIIAGAEVVDVPVTLDELYAAQE